MKVKIFHIAPCDKISDIEERMNKWMSDKVITEVRQTIQSGNLLFLFYI